MSKLVSIFGSAAFLVMVGCDVTSTKDDHGKAPPELIIVSEQLTRAPHYNIDLTHTDAIYYVAPEPDVGRLSVTCPSLATVSFAEYVVSRIRPTGAKYDPGTHGLRLANGAIPVDAMDHLAGQGATCSYECWDDLDGEHCRQICPEPDPEP